MAFETLKDKLTTTPVLAFPDYAKPFILRVDASHHGLGAVLCLGSDDGVKVMGYGSRKLSSTHQRSTTAHTSWSFLLFDGQLQRSFTLTCTIVTVPSGLTITLYSTSSSLQSFMKQVIDGYKNTTP